MVIAHALIMVSEVQVYQRVHAHNMSPLPVPLSVHAQHQTVLETLTTRPRATLPVENSTESFWLRSPNVSPSPTHGSEGPLTTDADICIIGSGITGVSAAYHLAQLAANGGQQTPITVAILEAREFCGCMCAPFRACH